MRQAPSRLIMFINKQFRNLWISQTLSQLATNILLFFISFFIYKQTASNTAVSFVLLTFLIPSFFSSVVAGVVVNRMGKKWVLFLANFVRAIIVLFILFSERNIFGLYILIFVLALTTQFFAPAESAIIPKLVPKEKLIQANAFFSTTINLTLIIGFLISPILFKILGFNAVFIIFFIYAASAFAIHFIKLEEPLFYTNLNQPFRALVQKFNSSLKMMFINFIKDKNIGGNIVNIIFLQIVMFILIAVSPGFADRVLRIPVEDLSFLIVLPAALGFLLASIFIQKFTNIREKALIFRSHFISSLIFFTIFIISQFHERLFFNLLNFGLLIGFGFFAGLVMILAYTNLQRQTTEEDRAGYFGLLNGFISLASAIPVLLSGLLSDFFGTDKIIFAVALLFLIKAFKDR